MNNLLWERETVGAEIFFNVLLFYPRSRVLEQRQWKTDALQVLKKFEDQVRFTFEWIELYDSVMQTSFKVSCFIFMSKKSNKWSCGEI